MLTKENRELADRILTDYLFNESGDIFDDILCDDKAYHFLSDEYCIEMLRKRMEETI